jgi:hypothetical protein
MPSRHASAPVSPLLAAQRRRATAAALRRRPSCPRSHQSSFTRHRAQASPPRARALCCARTPPHEVRPCCRVDLTLGTLTLAVLSVSFRLRDRLRLRKVMSLPWIRVYR